MRPSDTHRRRSLAVAALLGALGAVPAGAAGPALRTLRIESVPPGVEVALIGGTAGYTPLTIGERAIYPNDYPDNRAHLYGTVTLRRAGCGTVVHRVTLEDIKRGLKITLDCDAPPVVRTAPSTTPPTAPATASAVSNPGAAETVSERRLRQLQVLQELLDEGLIGAAEERHIRRRLLELP